MKGHGGHEIPVVLIDADVEGNDDAHRRLTDHLYGGDHWYRLRQELLLGIGGLRLLRSLGLNEFDAYHMNEGHCALLTSELLRERALATGVAIDSPEAAKAVRACCAFTTHTPVPAGHDRFPLDMVRSVCGGDTVLARSPFFVRDGLLDTTHTALNMSGYSNAVSQRHAEVTREMFPEATIDGITNGVHAGRWVGPHLAPVLDARVSGWRGDATRLREAERALSDAELASAHKAAKCDLIHLVNRMVNAGMSQDALTITVARRATPYKRLDLVLSDPGRLAALAAEHGDIQILFAGKAHPRDTGGRELIERLHHLPDFGPKVRVAFLPGYDLDLAAALVSGSDVWLNCPQRPLEASGTSGMKAALNGVPSLSVLDGWWLEGWEEGVTGWAIGDDRRYASSHEEWEADAAALYDTLGRNILPLFYRDRAGWLKVCRGALARCGSHFNTHRMVREYAQKAWRKNPAGGKFAVA